MSKSTFQGHLTLKQEAGGLRHYLAGEPVHAGELLELQRADGSWVLGRYEWTFKENSRPSFSLSENDVVWISSADVLRWPGRSE